MAKGPRTTKGNAVRSVSMPDRQHVSVSVRKIDNGYIISRSEDSAKGGYKSTEQYSATRPKISMPVVADSKAKPAPRGRRG